MGGEASAPRRAALDLAVMLLARIGNSRKAELLPGKPAAMPAQSVA
jgi:hypothetical protein